MVKTRHRGDADAETPPRFISLSNEKIRQSTRSGDLNVSENKHLNHVYVSQRHNYSVFDEKVVESRLRPRVGPGRAYNYLDEDSSDEDSVHRKEDNLGFTRSQRLKQEMLDKHDDATKGNMQRSRRSFLEDADQSIEDEDDESGNNKKRSLPTRQRKDSRRENMKDRNATNRAKYTNHIVDSEDEEHVQRNKKSTHRPFEEDDEDNENFIRRSSRTRRQVYDTLNQSYLVSIPGQRKQTLDEQEHSDVKEPEDSDYNEEFSDMYSRVKRKRVTVKRNMYGMPINEDSDSGEDVEKENKNNNKDDGDFESETEDDINNTSGRVTRQQNVPAKKKQPPIVKSYSLREHKPRTDLYKAPLEERRVKKVHHSIFDTPTKKNTNQAYHSPAQRQNVRKRSAFHSSSSSTSSSSDGDSSDEKSFKRRKDKSMAKARSRLMPMNYSTNALPHSSIIKDRIKSGSSLADVEPMNIDKKITFSSIGGLGKHIQALKEMVVFPLLYNNVFERFNVDPPRGVLFYGPPGTGKTLVARALANECSKGDRRVAFFMRKGADCLSKWVGESERQLRILFDQAYKFRPSIIFFDEIDGLAPVRSSRQDQIHSSIVSTLLALMDGLDSRGEIVVIGATNRIDSLDPALRRPGRFDREFLFPLPSFEARKQILKIHTNSWTPKLNEQFICELAEKCVGYCGADLKSLCTEAAMLALRRRYPQIYMTNEALQIDVKSINISARDFFGAVNTIIPTCQRAVSAPARSLSARVQPLVQRQLDSAISILKDTFPPIVSQASILDAIAMPNQAQSLCENSSIWDDFVSDEDENGPSIYATSNKGKALRKSTEENYSRPNFFNFSRSLPGCPSTFRPRLMLVGKVGQGQTSYVAPAILHKMENLPVHVLDLPALYAVTAKTPEESCANVFHEAKRKCPSIIYLPHINQWWDIMAETLKATLLTLIHDLNPSLPLLLLATSEQPYETLEDGLQALFSCTRGEIIEMVDPNSEERRAFFQDLFLEQACTPPPQKKKAEMLQLVKETKKGNNTLIDEVTCETIFDIEPKTSYLVDKVKTQSTQDVQVKKGRKRKQVDPSLHSCSKKLHLTKKNLKEVPLSTHKMNLRQRTNTGKLNFNHSAIEESNCINKCMIVQSKYPSTCLNRPLVTNTAPIYTDIIIKETTQWKSARKGLSVTSRHKRYARRLLMKERNAITAISKLYSPKTGDNQCCGYSSCAILSEKASTKDETKPINRFDSNYISTQNNKAIGLNRSSINVNIPVLHIRAKRSAENLVEHQAVSNVHYNLRSLSRKQYAQRMLEVLPKAAPPKPTELTKQELEQLIEKEELTLMELRIFLRDVLNKLGSDKKFSIFAKPVNIENAPDYYEIIEHPMDLSTMMAKIDLHEYGTVRAFMGDIDLICSNALEYNPNRGPMDRIIRHRACALKDTAYAILKTELDKDFEKTCVEIEASRKRRGHKSSTVPNFYCTKPQQQTTKKSDSSISIENVKANGSIPKPEGERYSKRLRGLNSDPVLPLEAVEKVFKLSRLSAPEESKTDTRETSNSIQEETLTDNKHIDKPNQIALANDTVTKEENKSSTSELPKGGKIQSPSTSAAKLKKKFKPNIWCKPKRKRPRLMSKSEPSHQEDTGMEVNLIEHFSDGSVHGEVDNLTSPSQQLSQQLRINTSENELCESREKSTVTGKATRLKSPQISPRISTRRSSMSPTSCALKGTEQSSSGQKPMEEVKDNTLHQCDQLKQTEDNCHLELRRDGCVGTESLVKPSAVKRLDLEAVALDSGIGSSIESNGDSRDSTDHNKIQMTAKQSVNLPSSSKDAADLNLQKNANQNCNSALLSAASALLNESQKELIIDKNHLTSLLNALVINTEGCCVEMLEKIYSQLIQIIFRHRQNYNRNDMIVDLEKKVNEVLQIKQHGPSTSCQK